MSAASQVNPVRLRNVYQSILDKKFVKDAMAGRSVYLTQNDVKDLEDLLRKAQPNSRYEACYRKTIYHLYKLNKREFADFLENNGSAHYVLWTDAMSIVNHFKLRDKVYLKWQSRNYAVYFHKKYKLPEEDQHPLAQKLDEKTILPPSKPVDLSRSTTITEPIQSPSSDSISSLSSEVEASPVKWADIVD